MLRRALRIAILLPIIRRRGEPAGLGAGLAGPRELAGRHRSGRASVRRGAAGTGAGLKSTVGL